MKQFGVIITETIINTTMKMVSVEENPDGFPPAENLAISNAAYTPALAMSVKRDVKYEILNEVKRKEEIQYDRPQSQS